MRVLYSNKIIGRNFKIKFSKERLITAGVFIFTFASAIAAVFYISRNSAQVKALITSLGFAGPLVGIALYPILGLSPIPADPLTVIIGAVFGPWGGAAIAWTGTLLAAILEYYIGTRLGSAVDFQERKRNLPFNLGELPVDSVWFLLGGRMLTGAGSKIVSYLSGLYRISLWRYLWTTGLSTLIGVVLFALGGAGLLQLF